MKTLDVYSIFKSINGEVSPQQQGSLCTFIRLAGCNLRCKWCDTPYAQDPNNTIRIMTPKKIISKIETKNVVITGGEPLMQEEGLVELLKRLSLADYNVSVETNGSIPIKRHLYGWANWVVDWKCPSSGMNNKMDIDNFYELGRKDIIKFVINDEKDFKHAVVIITTMMEAFYNRHTHPIFAFSPTPKMKSDVLIDMMKKNKLLCDLGVVFSLQIHKLVFPKGEKEI